MDQSHTTNQTSARPCQRLLTDQLVPIVRGSNTSTTDWFEWALGLAVARPHHVGSGGQYQFHHVPYRPGVPAVAPTTGTSVTLLYFVSWASLWGKFIFCGIIKKSYLEVLKKYKTLLLAWWKICIQSFNSKLNFTKDIN
jgi:hypothetical protein